MQRSDKDRGLESRDDPEHPQPAVTVNTGPGEVAITADYRTQGEIVKNKFIDAVKSLNRFTTWAHASVRDLCSQLRRGGLGQGCPGREKVVIVLIVLYVDSNRGSSSSRWSAS